MKENKYIKTPAYKGISKLSRILYSRAAKKEQSTSATLQLIAIIPKENVKKLPINHFEQRAL